MRAAEERADIWHVKADKATIKHNEDKQEAKAVKEHVRSLEGEHLTILETKQEAENEFLKSYIYDKKSVEEIENTKHFWEVQ